MVLIFLTIELLNLFCVKLGVYLKKEIIYGYFTINER